MVWGFAGVGFAVWMLRMVWGFAGMGLRGMDASHGLGLRRCGLARERTPRVACKPPQVDPTRSVDPKVACKPPQVYPTRSVDPKARSVQTN